MVTLVHKDRSLQKQPLEMCFRREVIQKSIKINFKNTLDENKLQKTKSLLAFHFTKIASIEDASKKSDIKKTGQFPQKNRSSGCF